MMKKTSMLFLLLGLSLLLIFGLPLSASAAHVHDWRCNTNGTHSCQDLNCGQQGVSCTFTTAPTCKTAQSCTVCGGAWRNLDVHEGETELRYVKAATCHEAGYSGDLYCLGCGYVTVYGSTIAIDPANHEGESELVDIISATCHTPGYTGDVWCFSCRHYIRTGQETPYDPTNHRGQTEIRDARPATCYAEGSTGGTWCLGCRTKISSGSVLPTLAHAWQSNGNGTHSCQNAGCPQRNLNCASASTPTCSTAAACADCGYRWKNPQNHQGNTRRIDVVIADCHTQGYSGDVLCLGCNRVRQTGGYLPINPNKHTGGTALRDVVAATCCTPGSLGATWCLGCETPLVQKQATPINPTNHAGGTALRGIVPATCHTLGYSGDLCCVSCDTGLETGAATPLIPDNHYGETERRSPIAATCHTPGYAGNVWCLGCETVIAAGEALPIDPASHEGATEIRGTKAPTLLDEGYTGDTWCLSCETIIAAGEPIEKLPMRYWNMTVCSIGPRLRDVTDADRSWRMFTPIDLSQDSTQTFPLIAGDMHEVGKVTVKVSAGFVTISRRYYSLDVWAQDEFMTLLPNAQSVTAEALSQGGFAFDQPISIGDALGGDMKVVLVIRCEVIYPVVMKPLLPFEAGQDYLELVDELLVNMD